MRGLLISTALITLFGQGAEARLFCNGDEVTGWHFYCDPEPEEDPEPQPEPEPETTQAPEPAPEPDPKPLTATEQIEAYRKHANELKHRAILEPTPENLQAYMRVNREMVVMAQKFTAVWQRVLFSYPDLDANVKRPLTQMGTHIYQDQKNLAERAALQRAAEDATLIFVFDDPAYCRVCLAQSQILDAMRQQYGVEILAVSTDGSAIEHFPDAVADSGQLESLGMSEFPRPFVAVVDLTNGAVDHIGGGLLTEDQILERIRVVREIPIGERYE
ncbi:conjugal transfer protein TraF [Ruegeria jejuensis]|uniref:conjugal transfer protein TraF n=1 Tax=Ruegeria jejuensis TaxID=3233338 RepID=UPI00355B03B9